MWLEVNGRQYTVRCVLGKTLKKKNNTVHTSTNTMCASKSYAFSGCTY